MRLPEPARHIWIRHHKTLREIAKNYGGDGRLMLGGETTLAARWKHRLSTDIDVLLADRESVVGLAMEQSHDLAKQVGGRWIDATMTRVKVQVGAGKLDVTAAPPMLPGKERIEPVEGHEAIVLDSAQILRGKFNRTAEGVARDAFDTITAARAEPKALEEAINSLTAQQAEKIADDWRITNDQMAADAEISLHGIPPQYQTDLSRLGHEAAEQIHEHRYERVRIRAGENRIFVETRTRNGVERERVYANTTAENALTQSGMRFYLPANAGVDSNAMAAGLEHAVEQGHNITLLNTTDGKPGDTLYTYLAEQRESMNRASAHTDSRPPQAPQHNDDPQRFSRTDAIDRPKSMPKISPGGADAPPVSAPPSRATGYSDSIQRDRGRLTHKM